MTVAISLDGGLAALGQPWSLHDPRVLSPVPG